MTEELSRKMVASSTNFRDARSLSALATRASAPELENRVIRLASLAQSPGTPCTNAPRIDAPQTSISSCAGSCIELAPAASPRMRLGLWLDQGPLLLYCIP
jgi:hypothetical protein